MIDLKCLGDCYGIERKQSPFEYNIESWISSLSLRFLGGKNRRSSSRWNSRTCRTVDRDGSFPAPLTEISNTGQSMATFRPVDWTLVRPVLRRQVSDPLKIGRYGRPNAKHRNVSRRCKKSESKTKELDLVVANGSQPQLTLLTVDPDGRVRQSSPTLIPIKPVDWTIDFQLPERVRVGEELVVDVALTNRFHNCSQVSLVDDRFLF